MKLVLRLALAGLLLLAAVGREAPAQAPPLEEFLPSEHVPADSAVAFPVDI